jgi:hypothetical protein
MELPHERARHAEQDRDQEHVEQCGLELCVRLGYSLRVGLALSG